VKTCNRTTLGNIVLYVILLPLSFIWVCLAAFLIVIDLTKPIEAEKPELAYYTVPAVEYVEYEVDGVMVTCIDGEFRLEEVERGEIEIHVEEEGAATCDFQNTPSVGVRYNCVDIALSILTILERHDTLDNVYLLVGWGISILPEAHVQVVRKVGDEITPLAKSGVFVIPSDIEVDMNEFHKFYDPYLFRAAAMKYEELKVGHLELFDGIRKGV
jgi:hypothetical protein